MWLLATGPRKQINPCPLKSWLRWSIALGFACAALLHHASLITLPHWPWRQWGRWGIISFCWLKLLPPAQWCQTPWQLWGSRKIRAQHSQELWQAWSCLCSRRIRGLFSDRHGARLPHSLYLSCPPHHHLNLLEAGQIVTHHPSSETVWFFKEMKHYMKLIEANRIILLLAKVFSLVPEVLGSTKGLGRDHAALYSSVLNADSGIMRHPSSLSSTKT